MTIIFQEDSFITDILQRKGKSRAKGFIIAKAQKKTHGVVRVCHYMKSNPDMGISPYRESSGAFEFWRHCIEFVSVFGKFIQVA